MTEQTTKTRKQVGALAVRTGVDGRVEVLLVTSRVSRNWLIPKGWPMKGRGSARSAAQEALEEAGIVCEPGRKLGKYDYVKVKPDGGGIPCTVHVFRMDVREELAEWREQGQRDRRWMSPSEAAAIVHEPGLAEFLRDFDRMAAPGPDLFLAAPRASIRVPTETSMTTLQELRTAQADHIAENFDFSLCVVDGKGWEYTTPGREMTKVYFFENPEDPSGDTVKGHFTVVFENETSAKAVEAYAAVAGNRVGNLMGGELADYEITEADLTAPSPR